MNVITLRQLAEETGQPWTTLAGIAACKEIPFTGGYGDECEVAPADAEALREHFRQATESKLAPAAPDTESAGIEWTEITWAGPGTVRCWPNPELQGNVGGGKSNAVKELLASVQQFADERADALGLERAPVILCMEEIGPEFDLPALAAPALKAAIAGRDRRIQRPDGTVYDPDAEDSEG